MSQQYDAVVYRGRFQGFHDAHLSTILLALEHGKKVIVVIGSAGEPRTFYRNPFYAVERIEVIKASLNFNPRRDDISFVEIEDNPSDEVWADNVVASVNREVGRLFEDTSKETRVISYKVAQIGFKKDADCVRDVALFPDWEYISTPHFAPVNGTDVRDILFSDKPLSFLRGVCPSGTVEFFERFRKTIDFAELMAEKKYVENYRKAFASLEYEPTFVTGDNVAFQDDTVLLVKRKNHPGKGLWALPAGYFNAADRVTSKGEVVKADKTVFDCAVRELFEETKANVTKEQLRDAVVGNAVFEAEGRDPRGRIVTHVFVYNFDGQEVFDVEAADDADEVRRFHIREVHRRMMYADHYDIVRWAYSQYKN